MKPTLNRILQLLEPFPKQALFNMSAVKVFRKLCGKEIAHNKQYLLFPAVFVCFVELSTIFIKIRTVVCKLFKLEEYKSFHSGKSLNQMAFKFLCPRIKRLGVYCFTVVCLSVHPSVHLSVYPFCLSAQT